MIVDRPLRLEFVPPSASRAWHTSTPRARLALLGALLLCAGAAATAGLALRDAAADARERARLAPPRPAAAAAGRGVPEAEANAVNAAITRLNMPWPQVLDAVEKATPDTVALLSVEPDARSDLIRLVAEAGSTQDMLQYVERLKSQPVLAQVFLLGHEVDAQDTNLPLRFRIEAHWVSRLP